MADCAERAARAGQLGGKVCVPPTDIPNVGRFSVIADPQGAALVRPLGSEFAVNGGARDGAIPLLESPTVQGLLGPREGSKQRVKQASVKPFEDQGLPVQFLRNPAADKEQIARAIADERKVESGLVCALSSMEPSPSFEHRGTHMVRRLKPSQVIYQYQIHPQVGWMYARIQTWFPFNIQVGLNGREWLARQMDLFQHYPID